MSVVVVLSIVLPSMMLSAAAANHFTTGQSPTTIEAQPGGNVTFNVTMQNVDSDRAAVLFVDLPESWSLVSGSNSSDPDASFNKPDIEWLWFQPAANLSAGYSVHIPSNASDGSYTVSANGLVRNSSGQFWSNTTSTVVINANPPAITNATATDADGDGSVADGDSVTVSANVTNPGAGVDTVMANASAFGAGTTMLTDGDNDSVYNGTFAVNASAAAADGPYPVHVIANGTDGKESQAATNNLTLDTTGPSIENATAMGPGGSHNVTDGDTVTVSADVTDAGSSVDAVMANASMFGAGTMMLTDGDGDGTYNGSFTVNASMAAMDGSYPVMVTANDTLGNENTTATNELQLNTSGAGDGDREVRTVAPGQPGFGAIIAILALLAAALFALGRRD